MIRNLLLALVLVCIIAGTLLIQNARVHQAQQRAVEASQTNHRLRSELEQARLNTTTVTRYVDRVQVIRERGKTITKEIPVYVTAQADAACPIPVGFVRVHDAAAQNLPAPGPADDADAPATGLALSTVASTVTDNYTSCQQSREQLLALQRWLQQSQAIPTP